MDKNNKRKNSPTTTTAIKEKRSENIKWNESYELVKLVEKEGKN